MNSLRSAATLVITFIGMLSGASAYAESTPKLIDGLMVNSQGLTVYTFDKDLAGSGKSVCNGPCAALWPPVVADADAKPEGDLTVIKRDDGASQWAFKGHPVYIYAVDKKAGDVTGDNFKGIWHVIK